MKLILYAIFMLVLLETHTVSYDWFIEWVVPIGRFMAIMLAGIGLFVKGEL